MDFDDEVLYCYEVQIEEKFRRKGLGKFMMMVLELLAFKSELRKIMLTVLKFNTGASRLFKEGLKFEIDETSPIDDMQEQHDYEILSKFNKRKLAKEAAEGIPSTVSKFKPMAPPPTERWRKVLFFEFLLLKFEKKEVFCLPMKRHLL